MTLIQVLPRGRLVLLRYYSITKIDRNSHAIDLHLHSFGNKSEFKRDKISIKEKQLQFQPLRASRRMLLRAIPDNFCSRTILGRY